MNKSLTGVIPAVISPLTEDRKLDTGLLEKQTAYLCEAGASGFFVAGTTSEGAYLTTAEKREAFLTIREASEGKQFLCLACIRPSTEQVVAEMKALEDLNPDYVVAVTPFYGKANQTVIYNHYTAIADAAKAPVLLYNIPSCTFNVIELETVEQLSRHQNIAGIKDSTGDFVSVSRGLVAKRAGTGTPPDFTWIMGEDYLDAASLSLGCDALVSGLGNIRIEPYVAMFSAAEHGAWDEVAAEQIKINRLYDLVRTFKADMLLTIKTGAAFYGRCRAVMKMEGTPLSEEEEKKLKDLLETDGIQSETIYRQRSRVDGI
jgi:4-hydroxy-tetrahydrodipicolinate synthase